ncbi:MAG: DUF4832 domain-containing protein [Polyangiaceae bacterium]
MKSAPERIRILCVLSAISAYCASIAGCTATSQQTNAGDRGKDCGTIGGGVANVCGVAQDGGGGGQDSGHGSDAAPGGDSSSDGGTMSGNGATVTLTPNALSGDAPEIGNPFRGAYLWEVGSESAGVDMEPPGWPMVDVYNRITWATLEPSEGQYDFSVIESGLALAKQQGGKYGFRIESANSDTTNLWVPAYLEAEMPNGFRNAAGAYVPDWNSSAYMTRAEALVAGLGAQFNVDPRMGWFEVSPYGNWGEWHVDDPGDLGGPVMTDANQVALVNAAVAAFPGKRVELNARAWEDAAVAALLAGLPQIGWRQDCIGTSTFTSQWTMGGTLVEDRWMTAPVMGEFCGTTPGDGSYSTGLTQVAQGHIAMGAGNMSPYANFSATEQSELQRLNQLEGYRFVIDSVQLPSSIPAGNSFSVATNWSNVNVTPAYDPWNVTFQLRSTPTGAAAWQGVSSVNLETLMPTTNQSSGVDTPMTITDSFTIPSGLTRGTYDLVVEVNDPNSYYAPLGLAIEGRQSDGSYPLGTLEIQ